MAALYGAASGPDIPSSPINPCFIVQRPEDFNSSGPRDCPAVREGFKSSVPELCLSLGMRVLSRELVNSAGESLRICGGYVKF